jgi:hypothetical protein
MVSMSLMVSQKRKKICHFVEVNGDFPKKLRSVKWVNSKLCY